MLIRQDQGCLSSKSDTSLWSSILALHWVRTVPEVSEEKEICFALFPVGFLEISWVVFYLSWLFPVLLTFFRVAIWKFSAWISLTRRQRSLKLTYFHSIPLLTWTLALNLFCSVRRSLNGERWKERAHTHTHTHTFQDNSFYLIWNVYMYIYI